MENKMNENLNPEKLENVTGGDILGNATMKCGECGYVIHWAGRGYSDTYECPKCHKTALKQID